MTYPYYIRMLYTAHLCIESLISIVVVAAASAIDFTLHKSPENAFDTHSHATAKINTHYYERRE